MSTTPWPPTVTLEGYGVKLEPLTAAHAPDLARAAADGELWKLRVTSVPNPGDEAAYIDFALKGREAGHMLPFAVRDLASGQIVGSTRFHDIVAATKRVEIGYTWYAKSVQRTHINSACKLLLMTHGFETLECAVVGWRTDILNFASQRAIERLGAKREGVMLAQAARRDGSARDTVVYSIPKADWPAARDKLKARLEKGTVQKDESPLEIVPLEALDNAQFNALLRLNAGALGSNFVARNGDSIAQASRSPNAVLRAILRQGAPIGLVLLFDPTLTETSDVPKHQLYLWRLMVDFAHQGSGVGGFAMGHVEAYARVRPGITELGLSHVPHERSAGEFYKRFGFSYTGEEDDGELVMVKKL
jgi:N-acetyltransferase